ncbi:MAG: hypothetical protein IPK18_08245 [Sphingobacteriales bacterium]|jgi:hypothetical protein|nr:MAG: hypothetical protein IPK18_08245 [Sphingobacteriales bacterium]
MENVLDLQFDEIAWKDVTAFFENKFQKIPDLSSMLFIIGHRELGFNETKFSKEQKQDIIHVGVCSLLSKENYYTPTGKDADGWLHFEYNRSMPKLTHEQQEILLKKCIIDYIKNI